MNTKLSIPVVETIKNVKVLEHIKMKCFQIVIEKSSLNI